MQADEDLDKPRTFVGDDADRVTDEADGPEAFETESPDDDETA